VLRGHETGCERRGMIRGLGGGEEPGMLGKGEKPGCWGMGRSQGGEGVGEAMVLGGGGTEVSGKRALVNTA
jgi:hypothetical protein